MRIGIATTGGDAPGMNACIRSTVMSCMRRNYEVVGFRKGAVGLIRADPALGDTLEMGRDTVRNIIERGSTVLGSSRDQEFLSLLPPSEDPLAQAGQAIARATDRLALDGLILIGGDTTCRGAQAIWVATDKALPIVVIPASIDNDIGQTEMTIGFDTAVQETTQYIDKVRETARAYDRIFIVETMGRHHGLLAAEAALATGVEELLVPEEQYDETSLEQIAARVCSAQRSVIVVIAEGTDLGHIHSDLPFRTVGDRLASYFERYSEGRREVRVGGPGHSVRGASPTALSRSLGLRCGAAAVEELVRSFDSRQNFRLLSVDRRAQPTAVEANEETRFRRDSSMRILGLKRLVQEQSY